MAYSDITQFGTPVTSVASGDYVLCIVGGSLARVTLDDIRTMLNDNQEMFLGENAFYIEENTAHESGAKYCYKGGSSLMLQTWLSRLTAVLMDGSGNYTKLNKSDFRYTADGDTVVSGGAVVSAYQNAEWMGMVEGGYWNYLQTVTVDGETRIRHWISVTPLPGGWYTECVPVGMYKCNVSNGAMRSIPFAVPTGNQTINTFFNYAQARGSNYGLAGDGFRTFLLTYLMAKYGYRSVQEVTAADGTLVFGVGLDGTENTSGSSMSGWNRQYQIKTGGCLSLGKSDGKAEVSDAAGGTAHSVNVGVFENPYGQYYEMDGHRCSMYPDVVYQWDGNFIPTVLDDDGIATEDNFSNVECRKLTWGGEDISTNWDINMITTAGSQFVSSTPASVNDGIDYGDYYYSGNYDTYCQLWFVGGSSYNGSACGLAFAASESGWASAASSISARLDFHGSVKEVTSTELKALLAAE